MTGTTDGVVERYLAAVADQDWDTLRETVATDIVRIGPYGDVYRGRDAYVSFLAELMPTLPDYSMNVGTVTYLDGGRRAFAELTETVTLDGKRIVTPEVLAFDLTNEQQVERVCIYTRRADPT